MSGEAPAALPALPPIVCIHGMWGTPAVFARAVPQLEALGHQVVTAVLPLHDRDPRLAPPAELGRLGIADYIAAVRRVVEDLPAPPVLLGHSMGGSLAQLVAAQVPHAGLVLVAPGPTAATNAPSLAAVRTLAGVVTRWGWWRSPTRIGWEAARWGIYNGVPEAIAEADWRSLVWDSGRVLAEMVTGAAATRIDHGRLTAPALIIVGTADRITGPGIARATARRLGGEVDYHEMPGIGHWPWWGEVETRVTRAIADWLGRLPPA
ncbi:hypothetical protein IP88_06420 [alpha proteobacterium AAP81b]|nr:hypothetical protein IP88_06420 [alpha proteobacterium AAP81b]